MFKAAEDLEEEEIDNTDDDGDSESDSYACVSVLKEHESNLWNGLCVLDTRVGRSGRVNNRRMKYLHA